MKLNCPECSFAFDVPPTVLGPTGRRVRCSNCGHVWFQEPASPEGAFGGFRGLPEDLDIEPIPASVHPDDDTDDDEAEGGPGFFATINWGYLAMMVAGFVLALILVLGGIMGAARAGLTHPVLMPFYTLMGMEGPVSSSGLALQDISAALARSPDGGELTVVRGTIVNTSAGARDVPLLEITPIDAGGEEGEGMRIRTEQTSLKPQETIAFEAQMQGAPDPAGTIRLRFVH